MNNTDVGVKLIISKRNIKRYFYIFGIFILFFVTISVMMIDSIYTDTQREYKSKLSTIERTEGKDINLMCNIIGCSKIAFMDNNEKHYFNNVNGILKIRDNEPDKKEILFGLNKDLETILYYDNIIFIIDDSRYLMIIVEMLSYVVVFFLLAHTALYIGYILIEQKNHIIEKDSYKIELEGRLQRDFTESLSHETGTPIALIEALIKDLYSQLYPCDVTPDGVCDFNNMMIEPGVCGGCVIRNKNRAVDKSAVDYYYKILMAIDRLKSVFSLVSGSKHIKYSNGTVSIYAMLDNIVASVNSFKVNKITATYNGKSSLDKYAVGEGLTNGIFLNIVHNMINNSIEAKSTHVVFSVNLNNDNTISIYVKDNGRGIRSKSNEIIKDEIIFKYGYSTKDSNGNNLTYETWYGRFLSCFGVNITDAAAPPRGVGLALNRAILRRSGGDIELIETSYEGTTFKLTVPIKPKSIK